MNITLLSWLVHKFRMDLACVKFSVEFFLSDKIFRNYAQKTTFGQQNKENEVCSFWSRRSCRRGWARLVSFAVCVCLFQLMNKCFVRNVYYQSSELICELRNWIVIEFENELLKKTYWNFCLDYVHVLLWRYYRKAYRASVNLQKVNSNLETINIL